MFASLVAALTCAALSPGAVALDDRAMSLPADEAPLSSTTATARTTTTTALASFTFDLETRTTFAAAEERTLFTPLDVDCLRTPPPSPAAAAADWTAMVSRADAAGSVCRLFVGAPGRTAALARARSHGNARHLDGDRIAAAGLLFVPDSHAPPPLTPAGIALLHLLDGAPTCSSPAATPPTAPDSRIDRPPRS